jgi:fatty acid desaturase
MATNASGTTSTAPRATSDYSRLMAQVRAEGLLDRSVRNYLLRFAAMALLIAGGLVLLVTVGSSWWQLAVAVYWAVVFAQLGFLGHDAGHQQIFPSRRRNDLLGLVVSNLVLGLSYSWWIDKHNRHHRHPNDVERDPDVARNVIAWTPTQARLQRGALRFVARHQAALFFPFLAFEAINLHVGSVRSLLVQPRRQWTELILLAAHVAVVAVVMLSVVSPLQALAFVLVHQAVLGLYLGCSFAPNHKGMPVLEKDGGWDFLRRQVLTSRNVTGGPVITVALGGLNYQIEHHLFPSMPSQNLRRVRPLVRRFCADEDLPYAETNLLASYRQALGYLRSVRPVTGDEVS